MKHLNEKNIIIFLRQYPQLRIYKEAKVLKDTNRYRIILIGEDVGFNLLNEVFDEIYILPNKLSFLSILKITIPILVNNLFAAIKKNEILALFSRSSMDFRPPNSLFNAKLTQVKNKKILKIIKKINPDLIHVVVQPNWYAKLLIENIDIPIIYDVYDFIGISKGVKNLSKKARLEEKYCIEKSSGIIHKGPNKEISYYKKLKYELPSNILRWLDYGDSEFFSKESINEKQIKKTNYHFVHIGTLSESPELHHCYYYPLAQILAKQKIHFHIYPSPVYKHKGVKFLKYIELDKENPYFHLHTSLDYKNLLQELSHYDYGVWISWRERNDPVMDMKSEISIGNKLFNYLEAGLPIIINKELVNGSKLVKKYNIGLEIDLKSIDNLRTIIMNANYPQLKKNVYKTRKKLSLETQGYKLVEFYEMLLSRTTKKYE